MVLQSSTESLAQFSRQLEFRASLFHRPVDSEALKKLQPQPSEVFRAARLAGADSENLKEFIAGLAVRKVHLSDGAGQGVPLLTEDAVEHLADAEWSDCWQTPHADGVNNSFKAVSRHKSRSLPVATSGSPAAARNCSEDSYASHVSLSHPPNPHSNPHPHPHWYGGSAPGSGLSERRSEDSCTPSLVRISVDLLTGGKSITAVMDPLSTVLDLKQRIHDRERIPPREQVLFFGRERMLEQRTLQSYKVKEGSHLVLSPTAIAGTL